MDPEVNFLQYEKFAPEPWNCSLLNWYGVLLGMIGIKGMNTMLPFAHLVKISASNTLGFSCTIHNLIQLQSHGTSKSLSKMTEHESLNAIHAKVVWVDLKNSKIQWES